MTASPEYIYSELPAIELFKQLGYQYYDGCLTNERSDITEVVLKDRLLSAITRINPWISSANLQKAFDKITGVQGASLMEINQQIWELLRGSTYSTSTGSSCGRKKKSFALHSSFPCIMLCNLPRRYKASKSFKCFILSLPTGLAIK